MERLSAPGLAHMGRHGLIGDTRELIEALYIVVYEVKEANDEVVILAVFHGAQSR